MGLHGPDNVQDKYTSKYLDSELGPQFDFGHGSGYATFTHGEPRLTVAELELARVDAGEAVTLSLEVTNTSARRGDEVIQLYVRGSRGECRSPGAPSRRLRAPHARARRDRDRRVLGGARAVGLLDDGRTTGASFGVERGMFRLHVGGALKDTQAVEVRVI